MFYGIHKNGKPHQNSTIKSTSEYQDLWYQKILAIIKLFCSVLFIYIHNSRPLLKDMSKHLAKLGKKNSLITGWNLWQGKIREQNTHLFVFKIFDVFHDTVYRSSQSRKYVASHITRLWRDFSHKQMVLNCLTGCDCWVLMLLIDWLVMPGFVMSARAFVVSGMYIHQAVRTKLKKQSTNMTQYCVPVFLPYSSRFGVLNIYLFHIPCTSCA